METKTLDTHHVPVRYFEGGKGQPLVYLHGAGGALAEDPLLAKLAQKYHVYAPLLPGYGDSQECGELRDMLDVTLHTADVVAGLGLKDPILVGHSMGGMVISAAAERRPAGVKRLVFLCAGLMKSGETLLDTLADDAGSLLNEAMEPSADGLGLVLKPERVREVFYADCSDADVADAIARVCQQASAPVAVPLTLTSANFGHVPRDYIVCRQDRAISPERQRAMIAASPCDRVIEIDRGHSPFLSAPDELADILVSLAR